MNKNVRRIFELIIVIVMVIGSYFYDDIERYINTLTQSNINNVISKSDNLEIYYMDVGQADSILIRHLDNNILIDAGNNADGKLLVDYFKTLGISHFDYVIGTHAHEDHIGGMDDIINSFQIDHFYMPNVITTTKTFEDVLDSLNSNNIKFESPKIDSIINLGDLQFKVLYIGDDKTDLNNTSIVIKVNFGDTSYLFTGDATSEVEKKIIGKDLKSDVLKVGHHGSQYSSSAKFIKEVSPKYSIISVGKNNDYGHPKDVVLNKLQKINSTIYRTDRDGTILLKSDGKGIVIDKINTNTNGN